MDMVGCETKYQGFACHPSLRKVLTFLLSAALACHSGLDLSFLEHRSPHGLLRFLVTPSSGGGIGVPRSSVRPGVCPGDHCLCCGAGRQAGMFSSRGLESMVSGLAGR